MSAVQEAFDPREYLMAGDRQAQLEQRGFKLVDYSTGPYPRLTKLYPAGVLLTAEPVEGQVELFAHQYAYLISIWHLKDGEPWTLLDELDVALRDEESAAAWVADMKRPRGRIESVVDGLLEADEFDPREYMLTTGTSTDEIAAELVNNFGFKEGPRSRKMKGVRSFWSREDGDTMRRWHGQMSLTRTYVGDERNQTWAVDWYPWNVGRGPGHFHTSGPQHKLLDFLKELLALIPREWTNRETIMAAASKEGFETTHLNVAESEFDARDYVLSDPVPKTPDELFTAHGFELTEQATHTYNKFWPVNENVSVNVGGRDQPALNNVKLWAGITDPDGEAYLGTHTIPPEQLNEWLTKADKVAEEIHAALSQPGVDLTITDMYNQSSEIWERTFPYTPDVPVAESDFDAKDYLDTMPKTEMDVLRSHGYVEDDPPRWHRDWRVNDGYYLSISAQPELATVDVYVAIGDDAERGAMFLGFYTVGYDKLDTFLTQLEQGVAPVQQAVAQLPPDLFAEPFDYNIERQLREVWAQHAPPSRRFTEGQEPFDAREYVLRPEEGDEHDLRQFVTDSPATSATVSQPSGDEYYLAVRREDGRFKPFGPFRRDQIRMFNREWHGFRYSSWTAGPSVSDRDRLFSIFDSEGFDARDYFLNEPPPTCPSCRANLNRMPIWREIKLRGDRGFKQTGIVMQDGVFHANEDVPEEYRRCSLADILSVTYHCGKCNAVLPRRRTDEAQDQSELPLGPALEAEGFDAREFFLDTSSVRFNINGQRVAWNFGGETRKEVELFDGAVRLELRYIADEWKPRWTVEAQGNVPWKGQFSKTIAKTNCGSERLLPKRIQTVVDKAVKWYEKHKWGMKIYPRIYGPQGAMDVANANWAEFVEQNAGDLPTEFENQTEESAAAWSHLIDQFMASNHYFKESEEAFDPRDYIMQDVGPAIVDRMKELGYKQVHLSILTDRHATLMMNDPNPEYEPEEEGGGIDQTKRTYARNRVKMVVRELMGLTTSVYDFSGDGGTDYLYKICDPEHCGIRGRYEAQDSFDPREYVLSTPNDRHTWRVAWEGANDGVSYRSKGFPSAEKAMRYVYTTSLWNKASRVCLQRINQHTLDNYSSPVWTDDDFKEFPVSHDYELIDPDTGSVLIREALVCEAQEGDFDAAAYMLQPEGSPIADFDDLLDRMGFDPHGQHTRVLQQGGSKYVVQLRGDGKYRYTVYDETGHKVRGQIVLRQQLIDLLQQHLTMKLREGEEPFDARAWMTRDPDEAVLAWMKANGFEQIHQATFYTVWAKTYHKEQIRVFRGQKDERLGSSRWWLEIWELESDDEGTRWHNTSPGMGMYRSADNFMPVLIRAQQIRQMTASDDKLMAP